MSRLEAARKLREAVRLVVEASKVLNLAAGTCEGCGREHYTDFADKQSADALDGALTRIERVAGTLEKEAAHA